MHRLIKQTGLLGIIMAATVLANAQTNAPAPAAPSATENWIKQSKNPVSWMTWGADLRLRQEYVANGKQIGHSDTSYERYRARVWTTIKPASFVELNARLDWESRYWIKPNPVFSRGYKLDEFVFDNLNVRFTNVLDQPVGLTIGRQDMMFGGGWLVADGTPLDGSRTYYFDAARLTYDWKDAQTLINAIYIDQGAKSDRWLPPINSVFWRDYVTEQDERGVILYASNKSIDKLQLDGYFIFKQNNQIGFNTGNTINRNTPTRADLGYDGNLYTMGTRAEFIPTEHIKYMMEWAYQFGNKSGGPEQFNDANVSAGGLNTLLSYMFKDSLNNTVRAGYEYLSGSDGKNPGFDTLWGRWPRYSEFLVYDSVDSTRPCEWNNMHRPNVGWSITPLKKVDFSLDYSAMFADQHPSGTTGNFGDGNFKGHLVQAILRYTYNQHLRFHLWNEWFLPGSYYSKTRQDTGCFLRGEIYLTY